MEENLDNPPTRRAVERRTRSSQAMVLRGAHPANNSSSQYGWLQMRGQGRVSIGREEIGKPPEAGVADSSIYVQPYLYDAKSELRIKHDTEVVHTSRAGYVRKERGEPLMSIFASCL